MSDQSEKYNQLLQKLNLLFERQNAFQEELNELKAEFSDWQWEEELVPELPPKEREVEKMEVLEKKETSVFPKTSLQIESVSNISETSPTESPKRTPRFKSNSDLEKFLGENLANKIGILIIVLGVAIGGKYAIDNQMVSPLTRIILGYLMGTGLLGIAMKLKPKYETLSAVILSGAMVILYFITYFGYDLYDLFPQGVAFGLMAVFTAFTVFAALKYDQQIIAGLGLVGAYAVPFLLSNNTGNVFFLFLYMTLINSGILVIAFRKYWKGLFNAAFYFTWLIFFVWWIDNYYQDEDLAIILTFSTIFFLIFYLTFLAYKVQKDEPLNYKNVALILLNSFIYFGIGYVTLENHDSGDHFLGAFAVFNGLLHFGVCRYVYLKDLADKNLLYLIGGLVFVFLTIAVPIQLDGSWVTLIWIFEAALLFWIGRTKQVDLFEKLSLILFILGGISLLEDWTNWTPQFTYSSYLTEISITPFLNHHFLTGILFTAALAFMQWVSIKNKSEEKSESNYKEISLYNYVIAPVLLIVFFNTFCIEILKYFQITYFASAIPNAAVNGVTVLDKSLLLFKEIWLINFGLFFLSVLTVLIHKKVQKTVPAQILVGINILAIFIFFTGGLYLISEIREIYLYKEQGEFFNRGSAFQIIRYISLIFVGVLAFVTHRLAKAEFVEMPYPKIRETLIYFFVLWFLSSELFHWTDVLDLKNSYKIALSILWGSFSLLTIWIGITQRKQHLRLAAMILFGATLVKLFFYDIAHLNTIRKTIVLVALGVLLLIISFLYNKFKNTLFDENNENQ